MEANILLRRETVFTNSFHCKVVALNLLSDRSTWLLKAHLKAYLFVKSWYMGFKNAGHKFPQQNHFKNVYSI